MMKAKKKKLIEKLVLIMCLIAEWMLLLMGFFLLNFVAGCHLAAKSPDFHLALAIFEILKFKTHSSIYK